MQTNFFKSVLALDVSGDWAISIAKEDADTLIVSVLFHNNRIGDEARKRVPPILLHATAKELNNGFFSQLKSLFERLRNFFQYGTISQTKRNRKSFLTDGKRSHLKERETNK